MAQSEASILAHFLLPPASLPESISLKQFVDLFPRSRHDSPEVAALYKDLQTQRARAIDEVKQNIAIETKRGERQRREIRRNRREWHESDLEGYDERDVRMEADLVPTKSTTSKPHTLESLQPDIDDACADLEEEIAAMEEETASILAEIKTTIGDLSDLRTGRFNRTPGSGTDLGQDVLEGLKRLEQICDDVGKG